MKTNGTAEFRTKRYLIKIKRERPITVSVTVVNLAAKAEDDARQTEIIKQRIAAMSRAYGYTPEAEG